MAHEVFDRMVYSFMKPMWHNLAKPSQVPMTAIEIIDKKFEGGFPVIQRPVTFELNGKLEEMKDAVIIRGATRTQPEFKFGFCTERYQPLQPRDVAQSFDANVCEPAETMGFLRDGREMFITWVMPSFDVVAGDEVQLYGTVKVGFDTLQGAKLFTTTWRTICANTLAMAEGWAKQNTDGRGKGNIWKGKAVNKDLLKHLGYWMSHVQGQALSQKDLIQELFTAFARTPIKSDEEVKGLLEQAYPLAYDPSPYYPSQMRSAKEQKIFEANSTQLEIRDGIMTLFSGAGTEITPNYWGLFNATTEFFNHYQASKRPPFASVMFGDRQKNMMKMVSVLSGGAG